MYSRRNGKSIEPKPSVRAAAGTRDVSGNIVQVNAAVSETGQTANQVLAVADELADQGNALRSQVDEFVNMIRAG